MLSASYALICFPGYWIIPASFFLPPIVIPLSLASAFDAEQVRLGITDAVVVFFRDIMTVAVLLLWMAWLNWLLAGICLVAAPFIVGLLYFLKRHLRGFSHRMQNTIATMQHLLGECLRAFNVIKLHGGKGKEMQRFAAAMQRYRHAVIRLVAFGAAANPLIQSVAAVILAIVIYVSGGLIYAGEMTVGEFVSFFTATALLLPPVKRFATMQENFQRAFAAAESIFAVMDAECENLHSGKEIGRCRGEIIFAEVCFGYQQRQTESTLLTLGTNEESVSTEESAEKPVTLKNINLRINAGEKVLLVGTSGSGKSTLMNLLPRFYTIESGRILLDGVDINTLNLNSLRRQIAYVGQDVVLFSDTIRNNIIYGVGEMDTKDREEHLSEVVRTAHLDDFIRSLPEGIDTLVGEAGAALSGGQRQRVAIARALFRNAPIVLTDEVNSALDAQTATHVRQALHNVCAGRTCLMISHDLSEVEFVDRIVVLDRGSIVESGTHEELLARNGYYQKLYAARS